MIVNKPGKSKQELLNCLEKLKSQFAAEIAQHNVNITPIEDGYRIQAGKKLLFVNFSVDMNVTVRDGEFIIDYKTKNVPQSKVDEAIAQIGQVLEKC